MAGEFRGKVAIVTGGGSGIGEALCRELARRGAQVIVADINASDADRVAAIITGDGGTATARAADVTREQDVKGLVQHAVSAHGRLDYLFSNAGIAIGGEAQYLTLDHWRRVLDVDLYGVLHGVVAAYPVMVRQGFGHIVNTSSSAAFFPVPANAPYATAKHAVLGMSLGLRIEAADLGVKVSCVCPGFVRTNIFQNSLSVNPHVPDDAPLEELAGAPSRMMPAARAAEIILDGVARNRALIVFPASIRLARHVHDLFPPLLESEVLRQFRRRKRKIAAALESGDHLSALTARQRADHRGLAVAPDGQPQ